MALPNQKYSKRFRPEYFIDLQIGDISFNSELLKTVIYSSIKSHFNYIYLSLKSDANKFLVHKIYGKEPIKLTINLTSLEGYVIESIPLNLIMLKNNLPIAPKSQNISDSLPEPGIIELVCIPKHSNIIMNKIVNSVFHNKTMKDILSELITKTGATPDILQDGLNPNMIDQLIVPSLPFSEAIKYIHEKYGICSGPLQYNSHFSENKIIIRDLSKSIQNQQQLVIHQLSHGSGSANIIKKCTDGINYYTRHFIETSYDGNIVINKIANQVRHIVQPSNKLTATVSYTMEDLCKEHGITSRSKELLFEESLKDSKLYINDSTGYEDYPESCYQKMSKLIPFLSKISLNIEGDMRILNLTKVGYPVLFKTYNIENLDLDGKYILTYSRFCLDRDLKGRGNTTGHIGGSDIWTSTCKLELGRTTKIH